MQSQIHKLYLDNLSHVLDHNYHWRDGESIGVRMVTINTSAVADSITDQLATEWTKRWTAFINKVGRARIGRGLSRRGLNKAQRHFLSAGLPVLEISGNNRVHLHVLVWERTGDSVFASTDMLLRRTVRGLAEVDLLAVNIDLDQPTTLFQVVEGRPEFTWDGQLTVLKATRYLRGGQSRRLYELMVPDNQREARKRNKVGAQLVETQVGRSILQCSRDLNLGNAVQITQLDDLSMEVQVTATRLRTPYRRQQVLDRLLDELDLTGQPFSFEHPTFVANFDPSQRLATARLLAVHGPMVDRHFDPRRWCDRPGVFSTLYMARNRRCLRHMQADLETMDLRLFGQTYASAEQLLAPARVWWSKGQTYSDH